MAYGVTPNLSLTPAMFNTPMNGLDTPEFQSLSQRFVDQPGGGGGGATLRSEVKGADTSGEKNALIQGYAAAFSSGGVSAVPDTMQGLAAFAENVSNLPIPEGMKSKMLDDIANMMSNLAPSQAGGQPSAPYNTPTFQSPSLPQQSFLPPEQQLAPQQSFLPPEQQLVPQQSVLPQEQSVPQQETPATQQAPGEQSQVWSHDVKDGKGTIDLGDKYTITLNEGDASATVKNKETGQETKIWGDPHVDIGNDGKNEFDFKKDMTFQLDDGTKITVGTVPGGKDGETFSSTLTITNGDKAMQVTGLGQDHDGKDNLEVKQSDAGQTVDQLQNDGSTTIHEDGGKWTVPNSTGTIQEAIDGAEKDT